MTMTPQAFADALLGGLGAPVNATTQSEVLAWETAEGGNWNNTAHYNPLNTSLPETGSVNYQTGQPGPGVQAYTSWNQGVSATLQTLLDTHGEGYSTVVSDLRDSAPPAQFASDLGASGWDAGHYAGSSGVPGSAILSDMGQTPAMGGSAQLTGLNFNPFDFFGVPSVVGGSVAGPIMSFIARALLVVAGLAMIVVGAVKMTGRQATVASLSELAA
jgi:hypothetical protein